MKTRELKWLEMASLPSFYIFTVLMLIIYYVSLAASIGMDYSVTDVSQDAVMKQALAHRPSSLLHESRFLEHSWFIPFAAIICVCIHCFRSKQESTIIRAIAFLTPSIVLGPLILIVAFYLPMFLVVPLDGETLGEVWPAASAAGAWTIVTVIVLTIRINGWMSCQR